MCAVKSVTQKLVLTHPEPANLLRVRGTGAVIDLQAVPLVSSITSVCDTRNSNKKNKAADATGLAGGLECLSALGRHEAEIERRHMQTQNESGTFRQQ